MGSNGQLSNQLSSELGQDKLVLDLPSSRNKFGVYDAQTSIDAPQSSPPLPVATTPAGSGHHEENGSQSATPTKSTYHDLDTLDIPVLPRLSRASSMPVASKLGRLRHPHQSSAVMTPPLSLSPPNTKEYAQFRELSLELADSVQSVIQTLLQVSPSQLLDPAKEQFSACSLTVPTPSMSALLTVMKNLNYISANMQAFCAEAGAADSSSTLSSSAADILGTMETHPHTGPPAGGFDDFDIGEMLQSVGDALSGTAAQAGVDLVLFHGDVGIKHVWVQGDESGLSYALSHITRQILASCSPGDAVELGLHINTARSKTPDGEASQSSHDAMLDCIISIYHRFSGQTPSSSSSASSPEPSEPVESRPKPHLDTLILRRLLRQIGATLRPDLPPPKTVASDGRTFEIQLKLEQGFPTPPSPGSLSPGSPDGHVAAEPTLEELSAFAESLKGKKVALYASSDGSFARHLSSYLTAWGLDVNHVSAEKGPETENGSPISAADGNGSSANLPPGTDNLPTSASSSPKLEQRQYGPQSLSLVLIDDDVNVLRERLEALRQEQAFPSVASRKRPALANHHRRSSPQVARAMGQPLPPPPPPAVVTVHFTSLANYKLVKDLIESICGQYALNHSPVPEVMVIPKPAGPRRFLTALHTALTRPTVDPFFVPIATSPGTPHLISRTSYMGSSRELESNSSSPRSPSGPQRPQSSRTNSDRSSRGMPETPGPVHPPSPLASSENAEYFTESVVKLGSSPSSGLMIPSPDGQPVGIFFHPRAKTTKTPSSSVPMERDQNPPLSPTSQRPSSSLGRLRRPGAPSASRMSFSSLHEATTALPSPRTPGSLTDELPSTNVTPKPSVRRTSGERRLELGSSETTNTEQVILRKTVSPPSSPIKDPPPPRRPLSSRRSTGSAQNPAKKGTLNKEADIVPPISVLIVEDNPINRTILTTFMKKRKIKFDTASNGKEAVDKWRTGAFHLVLMDIQMPVMDGIEATKEIRRLEKAVSAAGYPLGTPSAEKTPPLKTPTQSGPQTEGLLSPTSPSGDSSESSSNTYRSSVIIVALTASNEASDRVNALAAGCNDFLTKPVSLIWLNNKIIEWGSIKALQMWADLRPPNPDSSSASASKATIGKSQAVNAAKVAEKLHIGVKAGKAQAPAALDENKLSATSPGLSGLSSEASQAASMQPVSSTSSAFWSPEHSASPESSAGPVVTSPKPGHPRWQQDVANDVEEALGKSYDKDEDNDGDDEDEDDDYASSAGESERASSRKRGGTVTQSHPLQSSSPTKQESVKGNPPPPDPDTGTASDDVETSEEDVSSVAKNPDDSGSDVPAEDGGR